MALTDQDYIQIQEWFLSKIIPSAANEAINALKPLINEKVNRCQEIYAFMNKDIAESTDERAAKLLITYLTGTSGQIDKDGYITGAVSNMSNISERFNRTGNFLSFSFDPMPASIDYVEETKGTLRNVFSSELSQHNLISNYLNVHTGAFNSFLTCAVIPEVEKHNIQTNAHNNIFENYYTSDIVDQKITNAKANADATAASNLTSHNINADTSIHQNRFNTHDTDTNAHEVRFSKYYLASEIDSKINTINTTITNTDTRTRTYIDSSISNHNNNVNAHFTLFAAKAPISNPTFNGNVNVPNGTLTAKSISTSTISNSNSNIQLDSANITITSQSNIFIKRGTTQAILLDTSNNTRFPGTVNATNFSSVNANVSNVNESNNNAVPNIAWCKSAFAEIMPFGSMPDYANAQILQVGKVAYIWKVNVPGYITVTFGHCPDIDYVLWASYDPTYLSNLKTYSTYIYKLAEGYGNGDRDQSSIFVPIYPGTKTYILPYIDYSSTNVSNMRWLFIPCMATRQYENKRNIFIQKMSDNIGSGHIGKNTGGYQYLDQIFNTKADSNIWITNLN